MLRYRRVEIARNPNVREEALDELPVTAVHAVEQAPRRCKKPIERCVLTTLAVDSSDRAAEVLRSPGHELMWHGYTRLTAMPKAYQLTDKVEQ